ncbi:MAG: hypothetical protein HFH68_07560 [Lachnospiraceae bacterium]|nr:hypothetical protein [Lachnospiraceae bacterium]
MAGKIHNAFDHIKADSQLKESTKQFIAKRHNDKIPAVRCHPELYKKFAIICIAIVIVAGINGYLWIKTPVSYISIDVNPSIELALNYFDRVVSVTAYNQEGGEVIKNLSLTGKIYTSAIDTIVESETMNAYLTEESELIFTIAAKSSHENGINTGIKECCGHSGHISQSITTDTGIVQNAHDNGLSIGKYYAYLQLIQYDDTITIDDCRDMSMSEIHGLITEHGHDTGNTATNNGCSNNNSNITKEHHHRGNH